VGAGPRAVARGRGGIRVRHVLGPRAAAADAYANLGLTADAARTAAPLAGATLARLLAEPYAHAAGPLRDALLLAQARSRPARPAAALATIQALRKRPEIARYRLPCLNCGMGSLGVDEVEEAGED
jgi:hypothetical protein